MATGYLHAAFESTPGNETNTPTLSTKVIYFPLITAKPDLNPDPMEPDDELRNQDEPLAVLEEAHTPPGPSRAARTPTCSGSSSRGGGGSGRAVRLMATTLAGNGLISVNGGKSPPFPFCAGTGGSASAGRSRMEA